MTLCLRCISTISTKLPPFSSSRNQFGQNFDRHLPKHVKSSAFLDEFFSKRLPTNDVQTVYTGSVLTAVQSQNQYLNSNRSVNKKNQMRLQRLLPQITRAGVFESRDMYVSTRPAMNVWKKTYAKHIPQSYSVQRSTAINNSLLLSTNLVQKNEQTQQNDEEKKPPGDLEKVYETLARDLPRLFTKTMNYRIYTPDVEFVNNFKGVTLKGIAAYVRQVAIIKAVGHFKFAYVKFNVLKITMHPQDNTVKVRWRISGITGLKAIFMFWKFKAWKIKESLKEQETWIDGFSTFYINSEGRVFKHVADRVMPDQEMEETKEKEGIPTKLATPLFVGLSINANWMFMTNFLNSNIFKLGNRLR